MKSHRLLGLAIAAVLALTLALTVTAGSPAALDQAAADVQRDWRALRQIESAGASVAARALEAAQRTQGFEAAALDAASLALARAEADATDARLLTDPQAFDRCKQHQAELTGALHRLLASAERNAGLAATPEIGALRDSLHGGEARLATARAHYAASVDRYNRLLDTFPTRYTARLSGHEPFPELVRVSGAS